MRFCHAAHAASFLATWPTLIRVCPALASLPPSCPLLADFASAYSHVHTTLTAVRTRFACLDAAKYHDIFGDVLPDFHPPLPASFEMPALETLCLDTDSKTARRLRQKGLSMVMHCASWLDLLDAAHSFDASNPAATVRHREARRVISASQHGSGHFLFVTPDRAIRHSAVRSAALVSSAQYRAGLYISALASPLDAKATRGALVTQSDRLGDIAINASSATARHNAANRCIYNALSAASTCTIKLGDKGDDSAASRRAALARHAHLNATHVPDIIELDDVTTLYESKCYSVLKQSVALGNGSQRCGGAASTDEGHHIAFGCTAERLRWENLGCKQRGHAAQRPLEHTTGEGFVAAHDGLYADALSKGHIVVLLITETLGGAHSGVVRLFRQLHRRVSRPGFHDRTTYGLSRSATHSFHTHHLRLLSLTIASALAQSFDDHADALNSQLIDGDLSLDLDLGPPTNGRAAGS